MLNALYNQVDEEVHKLVILSNKSQKELESLLEVCKFEEQTQQVSLSCFTLAVVICAADRFPAAFLLSLNKILSQ